MMLYVVHGWTYTVEPWRNTIATLKEMGVQVRMLKVPGLTEKSDQVYTIDDYAQWADRMIPDGAIALGHSNGGRILLNLCAKKPEKLKGLILLDAAGIYEPSKRKEVVQKIAKLGRPLRKIKVFDVLFHKITHSTDYSRAPENMKQTLTNMLESDRELDFAKVTTPCYLLWGREDTVTPPRQGEEMARRLPNAQLKFYKGWTHAPYISHPKELARAIAATMRKVGK